MILTADHHVDGQASAGKILEGLNLLGNDGRTNQAWSQGDEELQAESCTDERSGGQPGVLAPLAGWGKDGFEAIVFSGFSELDEVIEGDFALAPVLAGTVTARHNATGITIGGQEPMQDDVVVFDAGHNVFLSLSWGLVLSERGADMSIGQAIAMAVKLVA